MPNPERGDHLPAARREISYDAREGCPDGGNRFSIGALEKLVERLHRKPVSRRMKMRALIQPASPEQLAGIAPAAHQDQPVGCRGRDMPVARGLEPALLHVRL
jgi:hypothetical protein